MTRALWIGLAATAFSASQAFANTLYLECKRYESKCSGERCYQVAGGLRNSVDWRYDLDQNEMETIKYVIKDDSAMAFLNKTATNARLFHGRYVVDFPFVTIGPVEIILENKDRDGTVKERISIDKFNGFYVKYLLHTDSSIRDVPLGDPYTAYYGWCEDVTDKNVAPTPPADKKDE